MMHEYIYDLMICEECRILFHEGLIEEEFFRKNKEKEQYLLKTPSKIEYAVHSRYLHRGYYCPSPIDDQVLVNGKRGKILKKISSRNIPTHRYSFNEENQLYYIEYYLNGEVTVREYLVYKANKRYGFAYNHQGILGGISVEIYHGDTLQQYFWATCYPSIVDNNWETDHIRYEKFRYLDQKLSKVDLHFVFLNKASENVISKDDCITHHQYTVVYQNDNKICIE